MQIFFFKFYYYTISVFAHQLSRFYQRSSGLFIIKFYISQYTHKQVYIYWYTQLKFAINIVPFIYIHTYRYRFIWIGLKLCHFFFINLLFFFAQRPFQLIYKFSGLFVYCIINYTTETTLEKKYVQNILLIRFGCG